MLLAFPGFDAWALAPVAVLALSLATAGTRMWVGVGAGFLFGLSWYLPMFTWAGTYAGPAPWLAMSIASAAYPAALGGLLAWLQRAGPVRPLAVALAMVLMEWARSETPFGGFPWARIAFSQADSPALAWVSWIGVPGLGLVISLAGASVARALQSWLGPQSHRRSRRALGLVALAVVLVWAPALIPRPTDGPAMTVAAIQGDLPEGFTRTLRSEPGAMLTRYTERTHELAQAVRAGRASQPDLLIWPEGASDRDPFGPQQGRETTAQIMAAVDDIDSPVLLGVASRAGGPAPRNMMLHYQPGIGLVDEYTKIHLAPFGEKMPLRGLLRHLSPWVDRITDFIPGDEAGLFDVPSKDAGMVRVGLGICFEVVVDGAMRDLVDDGAQLLIVPTSNAWFGEGHQSVQHLATSRVRAVEHGRSVVHISNVGVSGLISPDGAVHQRSELFTEALLLDQVVLRDQPTLARTTGPYVEPAALGGLVILGALSLFRKARLPR